MSIISRKVYLLVHLDSEGKIQVRLNTPRFAGQHPNLTGVLGAYEMEVRVELVELSKIQKLDLPPISAPMGVVEVQALALHSGKGGGR